MVPPPKFKNAKHFAQIKGNGRWYCNVCTAPERTEQESMTRGDAVRHERTRAHTRLLEKRAQQQDPLPPVDCSGWDAPGDWYTSWDPSSRADKMPDFIPFWRDGVMAAERGEEIGRMEDFLEQLDDDIRQRNRLGGQWGHDIGLDMWGESPASGAWGTKKQEKHAWETERWDGPETGWGVSDAGDGWHVNTGGWGVPADGDPWAVSAATGWGAKEADWGVSTATESSKKDGSAATSKSLDDVPDRDMRTFVEKFARQLDLSPARREKMRKFSQLSTAQKIQQIQDAARVLHTQS